MRFYKGDEKMDPILIKKIESMSQYEFKNKQLLEQAFLPLDEENSYSSLELVIPGKRIIGYISGMIALKKYGIVNDEGYTLNGNRTKIDEFIETIKSGQIHTTCVTMLGLQDYIDIKNEEEYDEATAALLAAICGAIAIDSDWNLDICIKSISLLLDMDFYLENGFDSYDKHFVAKIYNWCVENNKSFPVYQYVNDECHVRFGKEIIVGKGKSLTLAKFDAAYQVYEKLKAAGFIQEKDEDGYLIGKPNILLDDAVTYLDNKEKEGQIGEVSYTFAEDGENSICICQVEDLDQTFDATDRINEMAKKKAAYKMICYLLGYRVEEE